MDTYHVKIHVRSLTPAANHCTEPHSPDSAIVTHDIRVTGDRYILHSAEEQGIALPFACRNGACTTCAVRILSGEVYQPEAMGLSTALQEQGYALLCVSYARSDLEVETQDEDEVYELQFGRYFGKGPNRIGLPLDEE
ncbi:2Fe-2S iron-sulfur cluster-binding protein [Candidatus Synechococcus calcipolaris G9]|uniref:2Fe-2S iron-sulfur cluster-binding protein n=1 Tax=Candidatus Synechococcus calcipolaris G9 TaxID=1497997 RepID=A0ABT6F0Y6_9SYNE|nr:2Fe-2S iron-sulfur cluster-binding protein [Candidatus Synechococcus calcipolaris]MDG2991512.1 2Fe-2S iron-sulfur cluster-binding protein [Candidatus Synechococcus calcipolaris G9]